MRRLYRDDEVSDEQTFGGDDDDVPDSVQRVRSETRADGDTPTEKEGSEEGTFESTDENNRLCIFESANRSAG